LHSLIQVDPTTHGVKNSRSIPPGSEAPVVAPGPFASAAADHVGTSTELRDLVKALARDLARVDAARELEADGPSMSQEHLPDRPGHLRRRATPQGRQA
jgi:hypothetical protein